MKSDFEVVDYDIGKGDYRNVSNYDEKRYAGAANEYKKKITSNAYQKLIGPCRGSEFSTLGAEQAVEWRTLSTALH